MGTQKTGIQKFIILFPYGVHPFSTYAKFSEKQIGM